MRTNRTTLSRALVPMLALAIMALAPRSALAQPGPEEIADRCVNRIGSVAERAVEAIRIAAENGVEKIQTLDENDRPARVMIRVANKTNAKVEQLETGADRRVNTTADKCLRVLLAQDADPALRQMVASARAEAITMIHAASIRAHAAVHQALDEALDDEAPEDGEDDLADPPAAS